MVRGEIGLRTIMKPTLMSINVNLGGSNGNKSGTFLSVMIGNCDGDDGEEKKKSGCGIGAGREY